jgi:hypothetical protein
LVFISHLRKISDTTMNRQAATSPAPFWRSIKNSQQQ